MKIDDLLLEAGSKPLSEFGWAEGVLELINPELTAEQRLTTSSTGLEAHTLIRSLSTNALLRLLTLRVDATGKKCPEAAAPAPTPAPAAPPKPAPAPAKAAPVGFLAKLQMARMLTPLIVGAGITLMGLILTVTVSFTAVKTGQMPDQKTLSGVVQIMGEMVKVYRGTSDAFPETPAPQPKPQPVPPAIQPPSYPNGEEPEQLLPTNS